MTNQTNQCHASHAYHWTISQVSLPGTVTTNYSSPVPVLLYNFSALTGVTLPVPDMISAGRHPLYVVKSVNSLSRTALFVAAIFVGADSMSRAMGISSFLADLVVALSLISVLVGGFFTRYRLAWRRRGAQK